MVANDVTGLKIANILTTIFLCVYHNKDLYIGLKPLECELTTEFSFLSDLSHNIDE